MSAQEKWTPGPWEAREDYWSSVAKKWSVGRPEIGSGHTVAHVVKHDGSPKALSTAAANAHLIAAAPDLYSALEAIDDRYKRFLGSDKNQADAYNTLVKGAQADWQAVYAALAKARDSQ